MAAVKWIFVVIFGLGSAGSLAMAFVESGGPRTSVERKAPPVALRDFPQMTLAAGKAPEAAKPPEPVAAKTPEAEPAKTPEAEPAKTPEPVAAKTPEPEPAKTPEPVAAAKPPEPKPEPVAAKPPEPKAAPVAAAPKPPEPKPEPVAAKPPEPKPEPVAAKPPEPKPEAAAPAPKPEGILNLRASDTADVFLDGKKLGGSPLLGIKAKIGNHKVRFDCYDAAGNTVAGPSQTITVKADQEVDIEFPCPSE